MHTDDFAERTAALRDLGGQRVWSLMISLFGDLAQAKGQSIAGPVLSTIMADLQVRPEAARVALHRLRNDGWIISTKSGRISQHSLSAKGRKLSAEASPRIYADPTAADAAWQLIVTPDVSDALTDDLTSAGFVALEPRIFVGSATAAVPDGVLSFAGKAVPEWLRHQAAPQTLFGDYTALLQVLHAANDTLPERADLTPVQVAVLRCLIVHNWRRLVLKHPALPAPLIDPEGPTRRCHLIVFDLLSRYDRPRIRDIAQECAVA